ncbi:MAG TPA: LuxR C-terminal-related transcriptional regulator [Clostridia bacterium]|nr:LuxR C-terminal-related transcriptional regulator [Clostridia bacterium]
MAKTVLQRMKAAAASLRDAMRAGKSMRVAVFIYLLSLTGIMLLGVVLLLSAAGVFSSGREAQKTLMENDLTHVAADIAADYETVSAVCVSYAKLCAGDLEARMLEQGFYARDLSSNADALKSLLSDSYASLSAALSRARASAAFLMLDTTVNPALAGAEDSRACIYLRNMEPNIINATDPYLQLLRGPASVARENGINMHAEWQMELFVPQDGDLKKNLAASAKSDLPLSHAYFWQGPGSINNMSDRTMLCVAPLIASDGTLMGACGFEVSAMLFSLSYAPDHRAYPQSFVMLVPNDGGVVELSHAFTAGGGVDIPSGTEVALYALENDGKGFVSMEDGRGGAYAGLVRPLSIYPSDSPFKEDSFSVALMMPRQALTKLVRADAVRYTVLFFALMVTALFASLFMSRRFTKPLNASIKNLRAADDTEQKTGIREIDELISSLKERAAMENAQIAAGADSHEQQRDRYVLLSEFAANIAFLSAAERAVFELYCEGCTAEEIAKKLYLSINTIKTHSKRIYMKLNVSSRKELLVFASMLKEEVAWKARKSKPLSS